jgi:hypothetical protein
MKEYNIIEAVEYLKQNKDAVFVKMDDPEEIATFINKEIFESEGYNDVFNVKDIESKWILQTLQRTHAEIMSNWFKTKRNDIWLKVEAYIHEKSNTAEKYLFDEDWHDKEFFNDLEMKTDKEIQEMED